MNPFPDSFLPLLPFHHRLRQMRVLWQNVFRQNELIGLQTPTKWSHYDFHSPCKSFWERLKTFSTCEKFFWVVRKKKHFRSSGKLALCHFFNCIAHCVGTTTCSCSLDLKVSTTNHILSAVCNFGPSGLWLLAAGTMGPKRQHSTANIEIIKGKTRQDNQCTDT